MKRYSVLLLCLLLTACSMIMPSPTTRSTSIPTQTATVTPLPPTPTVTPNPAPADITTKHEHVLTDPWNATQAEKDAYDADVISNWRVMLKNAGVENADSLEGYDLLNAMIEYQQNHDVIAENETIEQQQAHLIYLPFSLLKELRSDKSSLIGYHYDSEHSGGYGIGKDISSTRPMAEKLPWFLQVWNENHFLDSFSFYGEQYEPNISFYGMSGDLMLLYVVPGTEPNNGVGAVIRMYDESGSVHYRDAVMHFADTPLNPGDRCYVKKPTECTTQTNKHGITYEDGHINYLTFDKVLEWMREYKSPNIFIEGFNETNVMWSDGAYNGERVALNATDW